MKKTIDPNTGIIHYVNKNKKGAFNLFYLCMCEEESGINWEKVEDDREVNCLICQTYSKEN